MLLRFGLISLALTASLKTARLLKALAAVMLLAPLCSADVEPASSATTLHLGVPRGGTLAHRQRPHRTAIMALVMDAAAPLYLVD
jgi:hypothetical protein